MSLISASGMSDCRFDLSVESLGVGAGLVCQILVLSPINIVSPSRLSLCLGLEETKRSKRRKECGCGREDSGGKVGRCRDLPSNINHMPHAFAHPPDRNPRLGIQTSFPVWMAMLCV